MPWGIAAGVVGSVAGAAVSSAMSPSSSGGSGGSGGQSYYVPTGLQTADQTWQNLNNNNYQNYFGQNANLTQYGLGSLQQGLGANSQYGPAYQAAANGAASNYGNLAGTLWNQSQQNYGTQQALLNAGQQTYQTALDPQNALYDRTLNQLQQQTGATNSMYGLGSSAAGAGVANQALGNFNIDWQNNQLSRQLQGLQGYAGAASTAGSYGQMANQQAVQVPGYQLQAGQLPYQTAQSIAGVPGSLANTYGSFLNQNIYGPAEGIQSQSIPYMNYGQGAQSIPFQQQSQGAGAAGALVSQGIQGIGSAVQNAGGFSNLFSGTTGSFGGGDFSGAFNSSPYYSGGGNSYGFTM